MRAQFVMPADLGVLNAANLCPASRPVLEALKRESDSVDRDPSAQNRARLSGEKENLRKTLAAFLRVTPEEIVITRNTSEANNMVSSGIDLRPGDEVIVFHDNHPSNLTAWKEKAKRFRVHRDRDPAAQSAPRDGVLRQRLQEGDHVEDEDPDVHAPVELGRRSLPRQGAVRAGARERRDVARRRRAVVRTARRQPRRDQSGLLHRQRAQVAVRRPRMRRALHQRARAQEHLAVDLQRVSRRRRHLAHVRKLRPAR